MKHAALLITIAVVLAGCTNSEDPAPDHQQNPVAPEDLSPEPEQETRTPQEHVNETTPSTPNSVELTGCRYYHATLAAAAIDNQVPDNLTAQTPWVPITVWGRCDHGHGFTALLTPLEAPEPTYWAHYIAISKPGIMGALNTSFQHQNTTPSMIGDELGRTTYLHDGDVLAVYDYRFAQHRFGVLHNWTIIHGPSHDTIHWFANNTQTPLNEPWIQYGVVDTVFTKGPLARPVALYYDPGYGSFYLDASVQLTQVPIE